MCLIDDLKVGSDWLADQECFFGLRLDPSITENGVRMTNLLQTGFFHLIYGKIN